MADRPGNELTPEEIEDLKLGHELQNDPRPYHEMSADEQHAIRRAGSLKSWATMRGIDWHKLVGESAHDTPADASRRVREARKRERGQGHSEKNAA